jgi:hypothetical protein
MRFKRCGGYIDGIHMQLLLVIAEMGVRIHVGVRGSIPAEGSSNKTLSAKIITGGCNCQIFRFKSHQLHRDKEQRTVLLLLLLLLLLLTTTTNSSYSTTATTTTTTSSSSSILR